MVPSARRPKRQDCPYSITKLHGPCGHIPHSAQRGADLAAEVFCLFFCRPLAAIIEGSSPFDSLRPPQPLFSVSWLFPRLLIQRYLLRRVLGVGLATTAVVLVLLFLYVGKLAYEPEISGQSLFLSTLLFLPREIQTLLPLSLYLSILLCFSSMHADGEADLLTACAVDAKVFYQCAFWCSLLCASLTWVLMTAVSPAALQYQARESERWAESQIESRLRAGQFLRVAAGSVLYVEEKEQEGPGFKGFFARVAQSDGGFLTMRSERVWFEAPSSSPSSGRALVAENGQTLYFDSQLRPLQVFSFKRQRLQLEALTGTQSDGGVRAWSWSKLFGSDDRRAILEWQQRLSLILFSFELAFLAVPLSRLRRGRFPYASIPAALSLYLLCWVAYVSLGRAVRAGDLPAAIGLWPVHAVILCLIVAAAKFSYKRER